MERFIGVDVGAETIKVVELARRGGELAVARRLELAHGKVPGARLVELLAGPDWPGLSGRVGSGRRPSATPSRGSRLAPAPDAS